MADGGLLPAARPTAAAGDAADAVATRIAGVDWEAVAAEVDSAGVARTGPLLTAEQCASLAALYDRDGFRSRVVMARHGFGSGEYKYFADPLPPLVAALRAAVYPHAAQVANAWAARLGTERFPDALPEMLARCHAAGQGKPTPLLLKYGAGDYNALHQDLYGAVAFPLQLVVMLTDAADYDGGEFVVVEQRPRMQSRAEVVSLAQGEAALFATSVRPRRGSKGDHRVVLRHGVSRVRRGERMTLGVIFHDAA